MLTASTLPDDVPDRERLVWLALARAVAAERDAARLYLEAVHALAPEVGGRTAAWELLGRQVVGLADALPEVYCEAGVESAAIRAAEDLALAASRVQSVAADMVEVPGDYAPDEDPRPHGGDDPHPSGDERPPTP